MFLKFQKQINSSAVLLYKYLLIFIFKYVIIVINWFLYNSLAERLMINVISEV